MRGHVRKRGTKWAVVVDTGRDEDGKRRQKWHSGFDRKKDAERAVTRIVGELEGGTYAEPSSQTLKAFLEEEWLPAIKPSLEESTFDSYAMIVRTRIVPHIGELPVQKVTAPKLNQLYGKLLEGDDDHKALSARSVRYTHAVLRHALQDAIRWNRISRNVADSAEPPSAKAAKAKVMPTWDRHQLRRFLEAEHVRTHRLYPFFRLVATTGMRRGEGLALIWPDLDLEAGRASVTDSKTDSGRRLVALDDETVATVRAHRKAQAEERLALGPAYKDNGLVFCAEDGTPLFGQSVSRTFGRLAKKAGLPVIRFHDLRHGHATLALQAGIHPKVVQERLGHSSVAFTLDRYSHAIPAMQEDAAAKVAALID